MVKTRDMEENKMFVPLKLKESTRVGKSSSVRQLAMLSSPYTTPTAGDLLREIQMQVSALAVQLFVFIFPYVSRKDLVDDNEANGKKV